MKSMTILLPHSMSEFGAEISTKIKASLICPCFIYYNNSIEAIEIIKSGEIDCLLINRASLPDEETSDLVSCCTFTPIIKVGDDIDPQSTTELNLNGQTRTDSLIANIVYCAYIKAKEQEEEQVNNYVPSQRLIVKDSGHIHVIKVEDLAWVGGAGNYVELHMINRERSILHRDTMSAMEKSLKAFGFSRIHKSSLVNLNAISELKTRDNGDYDIILENGDLLHLSRRYKQNLASLLQARC